MLNKLMLYAPICPIIVGLEFLSAPYSFKQALVLFVAIH